MTRVIYLGFFLMTIMVCSCDFKKSELPKDETDSINYEAKLPLVQKAALKYFQIQKDVFKEWRSCNISLERPNLCRNLKGVTTAYIFDIVESDLVKGMLVISALKKWRPLIFSSTVSLEETVEHLRHFHKLGKNTKIEFICVDGFSLLFKVKRDEKTETYYYNGPMYKKLAISEVEKIQQNAASARVDFVNESIAIWEQIEQSN